MKKPSKVLSEFVPPPVKSLREELEEAKTRAEAESLKLREFEAPFRAQREAVEKAKAEVDAIEERLSYERTQALVKMVLDYPAAIDILAPEHTLHSCRNSRDDVRPNPDRCPRCFLQEAEHVGWVQDTKFSFRIEE